MGGVGGQGSGLDPGAPEVGGHGTAWVTGHQQRLDDLQLVSLRMIGMAVKAGLEKARSALPVVMAGLADGRKMVAVTRDHQESMESWL
jgi:hypothetical protein